MDSSSEKLLPVELSEILKGTKLDISNSSESVTAVSPAIVAVFLGLPFFLQLKRQGGEKERKGNKQVEKKRNERKMKKRGKNEKVGRENEGSPAGKREEEESKKMPQKFFSSF